ncbi:hypothetical protein [Stenomitos frigidus]|nr:hypothetical protein [Stenomitos frigidus]
MTNPPLGGLQAADERGIYDGFAQVSNTKSRNKHYRYALTLNPSPTGEGL